MDAAGLALPFLLWVAASAAAVAAWFAPGWWRERRRARQRAQPFPAHWRRILRRRVPAVAALPPDLQWRLKRHMQVFLAEKPFIGCQGQTIDDEVRVTIAAQACLLLLGQEGGECYPRLREVLVYPEAFVVERDRPAGDGLVRAHRQVLSGESWTDGRVVLAWPEVLAGAADPYDGRNVTLHEFAHQVDQDNGQADGRPWRPSAAARRRWDAVMGEAFARLQQVPSDLVDAYGATEPAEFFAVLTELFFERPEALATELPAVHAELVRLYRVDPAIW